MTFSDLCRLLYPLLKGRCNSEAELFDFLILNSIGTENEGLREEIAHMSARQKRNLCNGLSSISKIAQKTYPFLDISPLSSALKEEIKGYALGDLLETFSYYDKTINEQNFDKKIAIAFRQILLDNSASFRSAQLEGTATLRSELFEEDDGICPNCGQPLSLDSSKENAIVAIGLDGLSPSGSSKAIGLCRKCAELSRNGKIGKNLEEIKSSLEEKHLLKKQMGNIDISEKLMSAINKLLSKSNSNGTTFNMKSLKIDQKIDRKKDFALYNKIKMNVTLYFPLLYEMLGALDGENQYSYELLSASIKIAFINAEKNTKNKESIFNYLADQVSKAADCEKSVSEIIVSYFVQSCEVFHEISK